MSTLLFIASLFDFYSIKQSREVIGLYEQGESIDRIMSATGLNRSSVISYLPYQKTIYNMENKS